MTEDVEPIEPNEPTMTSRFRFPSGRTPLIIALLVTLGALILVCLFAFLLLSPTDENPTEVASTPPTEGETTPVADEQFSYEASSESGVITVTLETPIFLDVAGEEFSVQSTTRVENGVWIPATQNETTAAWAYGSIINYVFGVPNTSENQELLDSLIIGDEIVLRTRGGATNTFAFSSRELLDSDNEDIYAQNSPGITIVLIDTDPSQSRTVVRGRYVVSDNQAEEESGRIVELGETAQLENLQITATGVTFLFDRPEIPPGFAFYLIDYQVQNIGTAPINTTGLQLVLADDLGNLYALNPTAAQLGNYRLLSGQIAPGQTVAATAGYQIPNGLSSINLRWSVSLDDPNNFITVNIPFKDAEDNGQNSIVQVQQANVSLDGTSVVINGQITNLGEDPLVINTNNVSLSGDGSIYLMLSTNPAFPWVVGPGQTSQFLVTFQRPTGSTAVFHILNQPFELTGLR
ncbi:MAG: DUF4352 domain-containing protein [Candidatus Promineifilaceae bacterium]